MVALNTTSSSLRNNKKAVQKVTATAAVKNVVATPEMLRAKANEALAKAKASVRDGARSAIVQAEAEKAQEKANNAAAEKLDALTKKVNEVSDNVLKADEKDAEQSKAIAELEGKQTASGILLQEIRNQDLMQDVAMAAHAAEIVSLDVRLDALEAERWSNMYWGFSAPRKDESLLDYKRRTGNLYVGEHVIRNLDIYALIHAARMDVVDVTKPLPITKDPQRGIFTRIREAIFTQPSKYVPMDVFAGNSLAMLEGLRKSGTTFRVLKTEVWFVTGSYDSATGVLTPTDTGLVSFPGQRISSLSTFTQVGDIFVGLGGSSSLVASAIKSNSVPVADLNVNKDSPAISGGLIESPANAPQSAAFRPSLDLTVYIASVIAHVRAKNPALLVTGAMSFALPLFECQRYGRLGLSNDKVASVATLAALFLDPHDDWKAIASAAVAIGAPALFEDDRTYPVLALTDRVKIGETNLKAALAAAEALVP